MVMHRGYHHIKQLLIVLFLVITIQLPGQVMFPGVVASSIQTAESSLLTGMYGYWKLDESSGNIADSHGSFTGTASNLTYSVGGGAINTSVTFNGSSSQIAYGNVIKPTSGLSVSFWIKYSGGTSGTIFDHMNYDGGWKGWRIDMTDDGSVNFMMGNGTDGVMFDHVAGGAALDDNTLHHIAVTWDGSVAYFYIDNSKSSSFSWAYTIAYITTANLYSGCTGGTGTWYNGLLDEATILDRALTDGEVDILFDKTPYPF
jgi:hypothetical protein